MSNNAEGYFLRLDNELMEWIRNEAKANHRSISGQYRLMLEKAKADIEQSKELKGFDYENHQ